MSVVSAERRTSGARSSLRRALDFARLGAVRVVIMAVDRICMRFGLGITTSRSRFAFRWLVRAGTITTKSREPRLGKALRSVNFGRLGPSFQVGVDPLLRRGPRPLLELGPGA